jgi:hypothetical protein
MRVRTGVCRRKGLRAIVGLLSTTVATVGFGALLLSTPAGATTGPATHLLVTTRKTVAAGTTVTVTVTAETATNTVATTYTGTVAIKSSDPLFVHVQSSTLTNGTANFTSALFTPGTQTISATDTVNTSISGTSGPIRVVRPSAIVVNVSGSPLGSVTASPMAVTPAFTESSTAYVLACPKEVANSVTFTLSAAGGGTISAEGKSGSTITLPETMMADQALVVDAPATGGGEHTYWFRCLPPGFPKLHDIVSEPPPPGWILTGAGSYVMVMNNTGTPVWWRSTGSYVPANLQVLQHDHLGWGWGFVSDNLIYGLNTGGTQVLGTDAHELQQLPDGDYLAIKTVPLSGVNLTGIGHGTNQTISNCLVQEYNPKLKLVWTWSAYTHVSPNESELPTFSQNQWDVYHCNSIAVDPSSPNPTNPNILLSMRETSAVYYIENPKASTSPGSVLWKLGGTAPGAGTPDAGAKHYVVTGDADNGFFAQHDARFQTTGDISVFDDGSPPQGSSSCSHAARGLQLSLNPTASTASVVWQYAAPSGRCASYEGSFRRYDGGNDNLIGWGSTTGDFISEVNASGQPMLTISSPQGLGVYRAIKVPTDAIDINQLHQDMGGVRPTVAGLSPSSGPVAGGTIVTISGDGFTQATKVSFGSVPASSYTVNSDTSITATAPSSPKARKVPVRVTNSVGESVANPTAEFQYSG